MFCIKSNPFLYVKHKDTTGYLPEEPALGKDVFRFSPAHGDWVLYFTHPVYCKLTEQFWV